MYAYMYALMQYVHCAKIKGILRHKGTHKCSKNGYHFLAFSKYFALRKNQVLISNVDL